MKHLSGHQTGSSVPSRNFSTPHHWLSLQALDPSDGLDEQAGIAKVVYAAGLKSWQTRVLVLQPRATNAALVARLAVADMILGYGIVLHDQQERVEYIALLYTWDTPANGILILDRTI